MAARVKNDRDSNLLFTAMCCLLMAVGVACVFVAQGTL